MRAPRRREPLAETEPLGVVDDFWSRARADAEKKAAAQKELEARRRAEAAATKARVKFEIAQKEKAIAEETGATAEGELERTNKEIADDQKKLKDLQHECMTKAEEHEQEQKERSEELGALAAAKKVLNRVKR